MERTWGWRGVEGAGGGGELGVERGWVEEGGGGLGVEGSWGWRGAGGGAPTYLPSL